MGYLLHKRGESAEPIVPSFTQVGDKIIGSSQWAVGEGRHQERFMVFTVRAGRIIDMQGFASRQEAERFARR